MITIKFVWQDDLEATFQKELYESAIKDSLTGLFTKRHFLEALDTEFNFHRRSKRPLAFALFDIDYFKRVNDTHGHLAGDEVLKELGSLCLGLSQRRGDAVGRYGGEEFGLMLRETPVEGARIFCERLRAQVENHVFKFEQTKITVTISIGVATFVNENFANVTELIKSADELLYKAKQMGRNRVASLTDS